MAGSPLEAWIAQDFVQLLSSQSITADREALDLVVAVARAQVTEKLLPTEEAALEALRRLPLDGIGEFCMVRFGTRHLTYMAMLQLLAELHDQWVATRASLRSKRRAE